MKKYQIIYADPPWHYTSGIRSSKKLKGKYQYYTPDDTAGTNYPTMSLTDIKNLPVNRIVSKNSVLFLWTTDSHLPKALQVIEAWGF